MSNHEALIKRIPKGGTRSVKGLARQLGYLSRQDDPEKETVTLGLAQRHEAGFNSHDATDLNDDVWDFARHVYERSGRLKPDAPNAELDYDLTMHFVISFPLGTDLGAAERAGRDWAEYVFGHGYRNDQGFVERFDYVTAFHQHETDQNHPHMHVVVDRSLLGGDHLLRLHKGHPHWSYEAMRLQAVEAAANHGIELVATTRAERGLTERAMTDVELRRLQRLLKERPIAPAEYARRKAAAAIIPHFDPEYDEHGAAPHEDFRAEDETVDLRRGCTPILVPRNGDEEPPAFNLDDDSGEDDDDDANGRPHGDPGPSSRRPDDDEFQPRTQEPLSFDEDDEDNDEDGQGHQPAPAGRETSQAGQSRPSKRKAVDEYDPSPNAKRARVENVNSETSQAAQKRAGKRKAIDDHDAAPNPKRTRLRNTVGEQNGNSKQSEGLRTRNSQSFQSLRAAESGPSSSRGGQQGEFGGQVRARNEEQQPRNPVQARQAAADRRREASLQALHNHRNIREAPVGRAAAEWRMEESRLLRESRRALAEQRRAHAGATNVTTRAQAERHQNGATSVQQIPDSPSNGDAGPSRTGPSGRLDKDHSR